MNKIDFDQVLIKDRFAIKRLLSKRNEAPDQQAVADLSKKIEERFQQSAELYQKRLALSQTLTYPENLPIAEKRQAILEALQGNQVVIVAGETGSGKTTQLGKMCLEIGRGRAGMIAHTQPRRVAARSVAARVAEEMEVTLGEQVACQVRFEDNSSELSLVKVMTDGILLAEIPHDRFLEKYDTIIIDEAHERSLNIDFLLGYIKRILPKRPDLKVIITSATIDVERFSAFFAEAPIISVSGRTYPVEILYQPLEELSAERDLALAVHQLIQDIDEVEKASSDTGQLGSVLVFLSGEAEIRQVSQGLRKGFKDNLEVLPLYARLSSAEQQKIFSPTNTSGKRRVILATNVAETSLTVPGIRYVIDSGFARISRYSHRSKIQRLPIEKISQASANQRAGRCGRIGPGICFRMYSEEDFLQREAFTEPEILRTNLSSVILQMQVMRLGELQAFPFIESPDKRLVNDGKKQLQELGALDHKARIKPLGKKIAGFPIDPKLARILIQADKERSLTEVLIIVSALSCQDVREFPADKKEAAREKHSSFKDKQSDFMTILNLWQYIEEQRQALSQGQFRKLCKKEFIAYQRVREWRETHYQLRKLCKSSGLKENAEAASYPDIHKALLAGFITNIGFQKEPRLFQGVRNREFKVFPASSLSRTKAKWVMAAEILETQQVFAHYVASIEADWALALGAHILKKTYLEPHWSLKQSQVMAYQKTSLYGLVLEEKRRVSYQKIAPETCREIFIREALVAEQLKTSLPFYLENKKVRARLLDMESKARRRDLLVNDEQIYDFYASRLPESVMSLATLESWYKQQEEAKQKNLFAKESDFLNVSDYQLSGAQFPKNIEWEGVRYRLSYRFQPGHKDDGITFNVPLAVLNRAPRFLFDWLVPGILAEKCERLIKSLPKQYRRQLVPVPETVRNLLPLLKAKDKPLEMVLSELIKQQFRIDIPFEAWAAEKLEDYYKANIAIIDENGKTLEKSRQLEKLLQKYQGKVKTALSSQLPDEFGDEKYKAWDFPDLQQELGFKKSGSQVKAYPALKDCDDSVSVVLADYPHTQESTHRRGLIRLAMLILAQQIKYLRKNLLSGNALNLKLTANFKKDALIEDLMFATFNHTFFVDALPFQKQDFEQILQSKKSGLMACGQKLEALLIDIIEQDYFISSRVRELQNPRLAKSLEDIEKQRAFLVYPGFMFATPAEHLLEVPRYYKALANRVDKLQGQFAKDEKYTQELALWEQKKEDLIKSCPEAVSLPSFIHFDWMLQEYRVSLFAQQLKTRYPISQKRLDQQWQAVLKERQTTFL